MANNYKSTFSKQILIPLISVMVIFILMEVFFFIPKYRSSVLHEKSQALIDLNNTAYQILQYQYQKSFSDSTLLEDLQKDALQTISTLRYGSDKKEYYWIVNYDGDLLAHPFMKAGENLMNFTDKAGNFPIKEMTEIANSKGEGFLEYYWQWKDDTTKIERKISYVKAFEPWQWIIGTGMYYVDTKNVVSAFVNKLIVATILFLLVIILLLFIVLRRSSVLIKKFLLSQKQITDKEEEFRYMAENIDNGITIISNGIVKYMNPQMKSILGLNENDDINVKLSDFIAPEDKEKINSIYKSLELTGIPINELSFQIINKKGAKKFIFNKYIQVETSHKRTINYILTSDKTISLEADSQLRKLSESVKQSPVSIVITDSNGKIEYVNPKFELNTGYTYNEAIGENPRILKSGRMQPSVYDEIWKTIVDGKTWKGELLNKRKNGELIWESTTISPIFDDDDDITHYVAVKEDITGKKELENELIKAKDRAEESDRLKTAFLNNLSHEIRTPLNAIVGFAHLIKSVKNKDSMEQFTQQIITNSETLLNVIEEILDFSKLEAGKMQLLLKPVNIKSLLYELRHLFVEREKQEKEKNLKFTINTPQDDELFIVSDKTRLRQIFVNLLSNAVKFTDEGEITFGYLKSNNSTITFFIKDTGIGIKDTDLEKIFDRFEHGESKYISLHQGTGLGLTIAKNLVELLGGKIWVESELGKGSTFYFTTQGTEHNNPDSKLKTKDITSFNWNEKVIVYLSVEDEEVLKNLFRGTKALVHKCISNENLNARLSKPEETDIIILDRDLITEHEIIDILTKLKDKPFIILYSSIELIEEINSKFPDLKALKKPFNPIELLSTIDDMWSIN